MQNYSEISLEEQRVAVRNRVKEVQQSQFLLQLELDELLSIKTIAPGEEDAALSKMVDDLEARIKFGEARLVPLQAKLRSYDQELPTQGEPK